MAVSALRQPRTHHGRAAHGVHRGLIAAVVVFVAEGSDPRLASDDYFQVNYREDQAQATKRFQPWLETQLAEALDLWRLHL